MLCPAGICSVAQKFGDNATLEYAQDGLMGHPGWDIHCGYGSAIEAAFPMTIYSIIGTDSPLIGPEGYTQVGAIVETPLETFEWIIGHCDPLPSLKMQLVPKGTELATEANHGPVYDGNTPITLAMQKNGDRRGAHRHYQKRPVIKVPATTGGTYLNAYGFYKDAEGNYYQIYSPANGYNGCVDWYAPLFARSLVIGMSGYDVYLLQKALVKESFGTFTPTGYFGTATFAAVMKYQSHYGMTPVGSVGPLTRAQLNKTYFQLPQ
jgi:hypothetical protein